MQLYCTSDGKVNGNGQYHLLTFYCMNIICTPKSEVIVREDVAGGGGQSHCERSLPLQVLLLLRVGRLVWRAKRRLLLVPVCLLLG